MNETTESKSEIRVMPTQYNMCPYKEMEFGYIRGGKEHIKTEDSYVHQVKGPQKIPILLIPGRDSL